MTKNFYIWVLKIGVLSAFVIPFFVFNNLLFPYITSKQLPFNLLIELLAVLWVALIVKYPEYRPKRNLITYGLLSFFVVLTISALVGVDFNLSFFGDVERMLGVFGLYHFLALFFIVITVFRTEADWLMLLAALVVSAGLQGIYAVSIYPTNNYGTLGNSSYISGQMIFGMFFALYLIYKQKNLGLRLIYAFLTIFMFVSFVNAGTRGAQVGLLAGVMLIGLIMAFLSKNKKVKFYSLIPVAIVAIGLLAIYSNSNADWVAKNRLFSRIASINFEAATFQTRLISWKTAFQDFPNHPFFGTGYGNFAITFDKFFDPKFLSYENTYFDHAHNNLVDILATVGLLGLLTYLAIFPGVVYYFYRGYKDGKITGFEMAVGYGLLSAYFIQNIVLFDSFITYFALIIFLGFAYNIHFRDQLEVKTEDRGTDNKEFAAWIIVGLAMVLVAWNYNIRPWRMLIGTIGAQIVMAQTNDIGQAVEAYRTALADETILNRDSRASMLQMLMQNPEAILKTGKDTAHDIFEFAIQEGEKNLAYNPNDSFTHMLMASTLAQAANISGRLNNADDYARYSALAMSEAEKAIATNPGRPSNYYVKAQLLIAQGKNDEALKTLEYAASLNPGFAEATCQYGRTLQLLKKTKQAEPILEKCVDLDGLRYLDQTLVNDAIKKYDAKKDLPRLIKIYEYISTVQGKDAQIWAALADLYKRVGDKESAIKAAQTAAEIEPSLRAGAEKFIESLK